MKASIHFTDPSSAGKCDICNTRHDGGVMALNMEHCEVKTCEECLPKMLGALQGLVIRLETIIKALPAK